MTTKPGVSPIIFISFFWGFCFFYFNGHSLFNDYDTAWHIAAGDLIRQLGHIPDTDLWSSTASNTPWYNISWLWDVLISLIKQHLSLSSLYYFNAIFYGIILGALAYNLVIRTRSLSAIAITVFAVTFGLWSYECLRPYSYSFLMVVLFHAFLHQYITKNKLFYLFLLPLLMTSWVNIHGAFVSGFILIGVYGLVAIINKQWQQTFHLAIIGMISLLCTLISPYGLAIYKAVISTTSSSFTMHIDEWQRFKFGNDWGSSFYLAFFLLTINIRDKSIKIEDKILSFVWLFAGLFYLRNIPIFILCSAPFFAGNITASGLLKALPEINRPKLRMFSCVSVLLLTTTMLLLTSSFSKIFDKDVIKANNLPINLVNFVQEYYPYNKFLNDYGLGTYLIYLTEGTIPVFIDGRAGTAYPDKVLNDYLYLTSTLPNLNDSVLNRYQITGVITFKERNLNQIFANKVGWKQVFIDNRFAVYVKA